MIILYVKEPEYKIGMYRREYLDNPKRLEKTKQELIRRRHANGSKGSSVSESTKVFTEEEFKAEINK